MIFLREAIRVLHIVVAFRLPAAHNPTPWDDRLTREAAAQLIPFIFSTPAVTARSECRLPTGMNCRHGLIQAVMTGAQRHCTTTKAIVRKAYCITSAPSIH